MKTLLVAGARPNFMKVAPVLRELERRGLPALLVHTGQHYDHDMSGAFFDALGMREPDVHLEVGSGTHAVQTARVMESLEPVIRQERPDWVVTVGDVNSTLAAALVAAKLRAELGCRTAHVEAGLRSGDWDMPEEVNRVVTDRLSDLLFTTEADAIRNLAAEGIEPARVVFAGNVMIDTLLANLPHARQLQPNTPGAAPYVLATLHRPSNVDDRAVLETLLSALVALAQTMRVVLPLHPRTRQRLVGFGLESMLASLDVRAPAGYLEMLSLLDGAAVVLTDSGGVQEETTILGVPCLTLRSTTERPVTIEKGTNRLVPWPMTATGIVHATRERIAAGRRPLGENAPAGWDGHAASRIVDALVLRASAEAPPIA